MGGRYLITGCQIGELIGLIQVGENKDALELLKEIANNQFVGTAKDVYGKVLKQTMEVKENDAVLFQTTRSDV